MQKTFLFTLLFLLQIYSNQKNITITFVCPTTHEKHSTLEMMCDLFLLYCLSFEHKTELFDGLYNMKRRWGDIKVLVVLW